jgi:hemerythrin superfamily protein
MHSDMMELPVRGTTAIEILKNDHDMVKSILAELTQATEKSERMQCLERLKAALTIHNATEENLVYPALNKVAGKKMESEHLYHETAQADVLLFELDTMLKEGDDAKFSAKAEKFRDAVLEHIDDEEEKAFPHLEKGADPKHAQMLTESVREFRGKFRMMPGGGRAETGEIPLSSQKRTGTP